MIDDLVGIVVIDHACWEPRRELVRDELVVLTCEAEAGLLGGL